VYSNNSNDLLESNDKSKKERAYIEIKEKLKMIGWGAFKIVGYIKGHEYYKVKLHDGTLITMEKGSGRVMHILQDKTRRS
tara:strand:+ start:1579 stop:1818 length:240 start_codon:yes stop_codon:yes gene_type:complete